MSSIAYHVSESYNMMVTITSGASRSPRVNSDSSGSNWAWNLPVISELSCKNNSLTPFAAPPGYNITSEKMTSDYLTGLRLHVESVLQTKLPQGALLSTAIEYIVSPISIKVPLSLTSKRSPYPLFGAMQLKPKPGLVLRKQGWGLDLRFI